jgi:hypothetical protein
MLRKRVYPVDDVKPKLTVLVPGIDSREVRIIDVAEK